VAIQGANYQTTRNHTSAAEFHVRPQSTQSAMSEELLDQWEQDFRAAARADDCAMFREHLGRLSPREHLGRLLQPDEPHLMLEATIRIVRMCSAYATVDNRAEEFGQFLNMQKYNPADATDARYVFTFDL
jgi:hypothetical protein